MGNSFLKSLIYDSDKIPESEFYHFLHKVSKNEINKAELVAFITALSAKTLNLNEILCFVRFIQDTAPPAHIKKSNNAINIVGTGGGLSTFNISTTAAFVASAAGATVLKSGFYSYGSQCGSLDVLKALGINIKIDIPVMEQMLDELNFGFVSPDMYSPFLKRIAISILPLTLKEIGRFINTIGPLVSPFKVSGQITGVNNLHLLDLMSNAMNILNLHNSIVVWSDIGIDEFSSIGNNHIAYVNDTIDKKIIGQDKCGFQLKDPKNLHGSDSVSNAKFLKALLKDEVTSEARDTVVLNSGYVLLLSKQVEHIRDGIELSFDVLKNGKAYRKLMDIIAFSHDNSLN